MQSTGGQLPTSCSVFVRSCAILSALVAMALVLLTAGTFNRGSVFVTFAVGALVVTATTIRTRSWMVRAWVGFVGPVVVAVVYHLTAPGVEDLAAIGDAKVSELRSFHEQNGRYPRSLAEAHIARWPTRYGSWQYEASAREQRFMLWIGDYLVDGFMMYWTSEDEEYQLSR